MYKGTRKGFYKYFPQLLKITDSRPRKYFLLYENINWCHWMKLIPTASSIFFYTIKPGFKLELFLISILLLVVAEGLTIQMSRLLLKRKEKWLRSRSQMNCHSVNNRLHISQRFAYGQKSKFYSGNKSTIKTILIEPYVIGFRKFGVIDHDNGWKSTWSNPAWTRNCVHNLIRSFINKSFCKKWFEMKWEGIDIFEAKYKERASAFSMFTGI